MVRWAKEHKTSAWIGAVGIALVGVLALVRLPRSVLLPRPPLRLIVVAEGMGRSQWEMLEEVTKPLERRLSSLPGVAAVGGIESRTSDGSSRLVLETDGGADLDTLRIDAERRLDAVSGLGLNLSVAVVGESAPVAEVKVLGGSAAARTELASKILAPELSRLPGSGRLELLGLRPLRTVVRPQAAALAANGLTAADLVVRLQAVGAVVPAGRARDGAQVRPLVVRETVGSLAELGRVRVAGPRGATPLSDLAALSSGEVEDGAWFHADGEDGVLVRVFAAPQTEGAELARQVRERVAALAVPTAAAGSRGLRLELLEREIQRGAGSLTVRYTLLGDPTRTEALRRGRAVEAAVLASFIGVSSGSGDRPRTVHWAATYQEPRLRSVESQVSEEGEGRISLAFAGPAGADDLHRAEERVGRALRALAGDDVLAWIEARSDSPCGSGSRGIEVDATAPTAGQAAALAGRAASELQERAGWKPLFDPELRGRPGLVLVWDEILLAHVGGDRGILENQVRAGLGELDAGIVEIPGLEPAIRVEPTLPQELSLLPVRPGPPPSDRVVPLDAVAQVAFRPGPAPILRRDGQPAVRLLFACSSDRTSSILDLLAAVPRAAGEELHTRSRGRSVGWSWARSKGRK
jgi:multidrug efflux pump subunit AcrB